MKKTIVVESSEIIMRCDECGSDEVEQCDLCGKDFEDEEVIYCMRSSHFHYCEKCGKVKKARGRNK